MKQYFQIKSNGRRIYVELTKSAVNSSNTMWGWRVTKNGERWDKETKTEIQMELVQFTRSDIIKELVMNLKYAELEEVK